MVAGSPRDLHLAGWLRRGARADGGDGARVSAAARRRREGSGGLGKGLTGPCWLCLAGRVAVCRIYPCVREESEAERVRSGVWGHSTARLLEIYDYKYYMINKFNNVGTHL
jgi:hypothetical protein